MSIDGRKVRKATEGYDMKRLNTNAGTGIF